MTSPVSAFAEFDALVSGAAKVDRAGRAQVHVTGADAQSFLQSLLSQDLAPLGPGEGAHALLLVPQGKLDHDLRVLVQGPDDVWVDAEAGTGADVVAALNRFKIRVDVTLEDASTVRSMISVRGPDAPGLVGLALGVTVPEVNHAFVVAGEVLVVRADWPENPGVDLLGPADAIEAAWSHLDVLVAHDAAYERLRIMSGVPRQGLDIDAATIPQEAYLDRDAVSFTKGCFLGQELVCRIDSRGHVNRLLRRIVTPAIVDAGSVVQADGKEVGTVTSVAPTSEGAVALAMLRREVEPGASVTVVSAGTQVEGSVEALPET